MPSAFGRAMLDTIHGKPRHFRMNMLGGPSIDMSCRDFLETREEENQLLDGIRLAPDGAVLDLGCGVGRHLLQVRKNYPSVHCCGVDVCDLLLDHCRRTIDPPATFVQTLEALPPLRFDLILLMGNGLGVLGSEPDAVVGVQKLVRLLGPDGRIVIETANPFGTGYVAPTFTIDYGNHRDGPFVWGYSDRKWISSLLQKEGCTVEILPGTAFGGMMFFAIGKKMGPGSALES